MLKRNTRTLFAIALALTLILGTFTAAMADEPKHGTGTENAPADAAITKILYMPEGTTIPETTFVFLVTPITVDSNPYVPSASPGDPGYMPSVGFSGVLEIKINSNDYASAASTHKGTESGVTFIAKESDPLFANAQFKHAGKYIYMVTEYPEMNAPIDHAKDQFLTYSKAEYELSLWVEEKSAPNNGQFYIKIITSNCVKSDNGGEAGGKGNPTPGGDGISDFYSEMAFKNYYWKTGGGAVDPDNPDPKTDTAALRISKTVEGAFANQDEYFKFEVTLTAPDFITKRVYKAYVLNANNQVVTLNTLANGARDGVDAHGDYFNFHLGTTRIINLKGGERLVFLDAPVGTAYEAQEAAHTHYLASVILQYNGGSLFEYSNTYGNTSLSTNQVANVKKLVGENDTFAAFTNTRADVTPTGVIINNLPYIGFVLLSVSALVAYLAVKSKKRV
jgi:hypothetical protein